MYIIGLVEDETDLLKLIKNYLEKANYQVITFEKGNVKSLEKELKNLLEDESIVHMLKKEASPFITAKYNWDEIVDKTIQLYENEPLKVSAKGKKAKVRSAMSGNEAE